MIIANYMTDLALTLTLLIHLPMVIALFGGVLKPSHHFVSEFLSYF